MVYKVMSSNGLISSQNYHKLFLLERVCVSFGAGKESGLVGDGIILWVFYCIDV